MRRSHQELQQIRERLFEALREESPGSADPVALTQRWLDRWLLMLHLEDRIDGVGLGLGLREHLRQLTAKHEPDGVEVWASVRSLWTALAAGGVWCDRPISAVAGPFRANPELERVTLRNRVFVPLLNHADRHDFAGQDGPRIPITLAGAIQLFERSVAELRRLADGGQDDDRRRRDGVYYTPQWLADYLVEHTVGARLDELRAQFMGAPRAYAARLETLRVVDPACGAGTLLVAAFDRLFAERQWLAHALTEVDGSAPEFDPAAATHAILSHNLYGVDVDPASVEFAKLALWMKTAQPGQPLSSLDHGLRCGDALDPRAFAWAEAFPEVFVESSGFDCVIGNPPYVKLQRLHDRRDGLANHRGDADTPLYESTQTGNFDLCLPFIEVGLRLLDRDGRLGVIAPSSWLRNHAGEGLRGLVRRTRSLARWIDFQGHQVFADATTYTALQLFTARPQPAILGIFAPRGAADLERIDWARPDAILTYADAPERGAWDLLPAAQVSLHNRLRARCSTLGQTCERIAVGIQTSADPIYQLRRIGPGRYANADGEVALEDAILRPLLTGADVQRYLAPQTSTCVLFPYVIADGKGRLLDAEQLAERFPLAWAYLRSHEPRLRARERGKMDRDDRWWGYNYPKNLAKQLRPKLVVAQTVTSLRVAHDAAGQHCLDNVRVNGVFTATPQDAWFLLAVLNSPLADYVFRTTAKPKAGGYYEANKQFIAPLPVPVADSAKRRAIGGRARELERLHTLRHAQVRAIDRQLGGQAWLDHVRDHAWIEAGLSVPRSELDARLVPGSRIGVDSRGSRVELGISGKPTLVVELADPDAAAQVAAQWRQLARSLRVTDKFDATKLVRQLQRLRSPTRPEAARALIEFDAAVVAVELEIATAERELDAVLAGLYDLSDAELALVYP